jgi:hypothetical protein
MPTNEESVAWAEEADKLAKVIQDLIVVIETGGYIDLREAKLSVENWPTRQETEEATRRIWEKIKRTHNHDLSTSS